MRVWPSTAVEAALRDQQRRTCEPVCAYLYDLAMLREHARATRDAMPAGTELFYAIKANAEPELLSALSGIVDGFEVASGGELAWLKRHAGSSRLLFGGPGKLDSELTAAIGQGVELIHVESLGELQRIATIAHGRPVSIALRVNPALDAGSRTRLMMAGGPSPFGIDEDQLSDCLAFLKQTPRIRLEGFHIHALSHQLDMAAHDELLGLYLDRFALWKQRFDLSVTSFNMGGGIGIDYLEPDRQPDWVTLMQGLGRRLAALGPAAPNVRFELGRYLTASCGFYAAEIIDLKRSYGQWFAVCRGGTHHFRTPSAQGHSHPVHILPGKRTGQAAHDLRCTFVGQLCTPKDVLARDVPCADLAVGDVALFPLAGAYAWTISHHDFLKHEPPVRLFVGGQGETYADVAA